LTAGFGINEQYNKVAVGVERPPPPLRPPIPLPRGLPRSLFQAGQVPLLFGGPAASAGVLQQKPRVGNRGGCAHWGCCCHPVCYCRGAGGDPQRALLTGSRNMLRVGVHARRYPSLWALQRRVLLRGRVPGVRLAHAQGQVLAPKLVLEDVFVCSGRGFAGGEGVRVGVGGGGEDDGNLSC
jgi:hypothetical protein